MVCHLPLHSVAKPVSSYGLQNTDDELNYELEIDHHTTQSLLAVGNC
jgi:hypothetical protein